MRDERATAGSRRGFIAGAVAMVLLPWAGRAWAQALDVTTLGINPNSTDDQSGPLQDALLKAASEGRPLVLPAGNYLCGNIQIPSNLDLRGIPGATVLASAAATPVAKLSGSAHVTIAGIGFAAGGAGPAGADAGLLEIDTSESISLSGCSFTGGAANGLIVRDAAVTVAGCTFSGHGLAALTSFESRGLNLSGNTIDRCGNAGIIILASALRHDGSRLSGNAISRIGWTNGGKGENGNGISVVRCEGVIVTGNQLTDCAFSAVRLSETRNVIVSENLCRNSGEVAIVSQAGSTGSIIADNIVDGAATGIRLAAVEKGGTMVVCQGNVVRNIRDHSEVNADVRPIGILAEADTVISGNTVDAVPGIGIMAGTAAHRRNVVVTENVVSGVTTGIAVNVADGPDNGAVRITGNMVGGPITHGIVGLVDENIVTEDLAADAARYPGLDISSNAVAALTP